MAKTLTASYASNEAARNAVDELLSDGIDSEKVFLDDATNEVKVMIPGDIEREITEILGRHNPTEIH